MMVFINRHSLRVMFRADRVAIIRPRLSFGVRDDDGEITNVVPAAVVIDWVDGGEPLVLVDDALKAPAVMEAFLLDLQAAMVKALSAKAPGDGLAVVGPPAPAGKPPLALQPR